MRLLVGRPNYADPVGNGGTVWIAPLIEMVLYLRLSQVEGVEVIPFEKVRARNPGSNNYAHSVQIANTLKNLSAELPSAYISADYRTAGAGFALDLKLHAVGQTRPVSTGEIEFDLRRMDSILCASVQRLCFAAKSAGWRITPRTSGSTLPTTPKEIQRCGELLLQGFTTTSRAPAFALERMYRGNPTAMCALLGSVLLNQSYSAWDDALTASRAISSTGANQFPMLAAKQCELLMHLDRPRDALDFLANKQSDSWPRHLFLRLQAAAQEAVNDLPSARRTLEALTNLDASNPGAHRDLARVCLQLGDTREAQSHLATWAALTNLPVAPTLCEIGVELALLDRVDGAVVAFNLCAEDSADNAEGWVALARALRRKNHSGAAAECFLRAFALDKKRYRNAPLEAGTLFEHVGFDDRARAAYRQVLSHYPDDPGATIRLAELDKKIGRCDSVIARLNPLAASGYTDSLMHSLLAQCGRPLRRNSAVAAADAPSSSDSPSKHRKAARSVATVSLGVLAVTALGGGLYFNQEIPSLYRRYSEEKQTSEIRRLHGRLEDSRSWRDRLYVVSSILGAGFGVVVLLPRR